MVLTISITSAQGECAGGGGGLLWHTAGGPVGQISHGMYRSKEYLVTYTVAKPTLSPSLYKCSNGS